MNPTFLLEKILKKFRALVFDLDDTLYPERSYVVSGFKAVASWIGEKLGLSPETVLGELLTLHDKGDRGKTFNRWLGSKDLPEGEYLDQLVRIYREHRPLIFPYPGAEQMLSRLRGCYSLGLISDGYQDVQLLKLEALNISSLLDAVVFSDMYGKQDWKPSTRPFKAVLSMLDVSPSEAAYIADNPLKDFLGARELGITTIRVRHQGGYYAECEPPTSRHAPDHQLESILKIEAFFDET